jgi:hypothetical protein
VGDRQTSGQCIRRRYDSFGIKGRARTPKGDLFCANLNVCRRAGRDRSTNLAVLQISRLLTYGAGEKGTLHFRLESYPSVCRCSLSRRNSEEALISFVLLEIMSIFRRLEMPLVSQPDNDPAQESTDHVRHTVAQDV